MINNKKYIGVNKKKFFFVFNKSCNYKKSILLQIVFSRGLQPKPRRLVLACQVIQTSPPNLQIFYQ